MNVENANEKRRKAAAIAGATAAAVGGIAMSIFAMDYIPREPYVNEDDERNTYLASIIGSESECRHLLRMNIESFVKLVAMCKDKGLLKDTRNVKVEEQMAEFLHTIGHNVKNRVLNHNFKRSGETVSRYFHIVLQAVLNLQDDLLKQPTRDSETPTVIKYSKRFWPWFENCVGAIDGTHIRASVPERIRNRFRGRKAFPTQNVLAAVSFDLQFTCVLAGWEGSAHDARVLEDSLKRDNGLKIPEVMEGEKSDAAPVKKVVKRNFMWSLRRHIFIAAYLAECARKGEKKGKSFGKPILTKAAKAVTDEFKEDCKVENVEAWLKTAKKKYSRILELRKKSGWSWDDVHKIIKVNKTIAAEFIEENAYAKDLLNVPLDDYENLRLVCGEDSATGSYAKTNSESQSGNVDEATSATQDVVGPSTAHQPNEKHKKRSRQCFMEEVVQTMSGLTKQVALLTDAIGSDQEFCSLVFEEVMKIVEFDDHVLNKAFEYLTQHPLKGRQFIARRQQMRVDWLKDFVSMMRTLPAAHLCGPWFSWCLNLTTSRRGQDVLPSKLFFS